MARISTYNLDGTISDTDKVIGTDSSNTTTKNFRVQDLKEFIYSEISGNMTIAADGTASVATSNIALGINSGDYVAGITGGVGVNSTAATSGAGTNHTLSLDLSELSTVTSISTGNKVAISPSNAGNLITVDNLFIKSPKLVSEAVIANGDYMLFLDGGATGDMKKESLSDISTLFAGNGLVSSSSVINLDLNSLSDKSSIVQGDSLIIVDSEDSNANKKVTYAVLEDEIYSNISGDVTINSSGVSAIGTDKVKGTMLHTSAADTSTLELSSDTLSVLKVPNALTAGDGLASGGTFDGANSRTFSLDLNELTDATIANGDSIPFVDATDNTTKKEALSDIVSLLAGDALAASSSVLSVGVDDSTIEINSDALRVKANGITNTELNKTAITSQTDLGDAFADADTILLHDATASALREGTMAHLASYVNGAYDLEASLEALNASDNIIKIGHSSDKVQIIGTFQVDGVSTLTGNTTVTGSLTANGLSFPANSAGSDGQVLAKASDGTIGFTSASSTSVNDVASDNASHLPIVLHDESNNLLDDTGTFTYQPSTGILKVPDITLPSAGVITFDDSTDFTLTHISDTGIRINGTQQLQFGSASCRIRESSTGVLEVTATTLDVNAAADISGALTVGGTLTLDSVGVSAVQTSSESFADNNTSLMTSAAIDDRINSAQSMGSGFVLEDDSGDEVTITESKEVKFIGSGGLTINWTDTDNGTDGDPYDLTFTIGTLNQSTTGSAATLTTARNFSLTGNVTASAVSFDGSGNVSLSTSLAANTVDSSELVNGSIDTDHIGDDQVTGAKIADDTIDSNHYAAGSIDNEHIADNAINSEHYAAGSIDNEHLASNSVNSSNYVDASIDTEHLSSGCTAPKVTVTDYSSGVFPIVLHNDSNQLFDDTDNFQFKQTNSTISSTNDNQYTLTLGETTDYAHYLHGGNIDFKSGATISTHDAGFYIMGNAYYKLVSGSGGFVKKIAAPSEVLKLRDQELTLSVHTSNGDTSSKMTLTEVFSVTAAGNLTVTGELDGASLDISGNADIDGTLETDALSINGTTVSSTAAELNYNDTGASVGTVVASKVVTVDSNKDVSSFRNVTASGNYTGANFVVSSDKRLKSEIEPIKEGLEVIKQFTSYNYIKAGEKESGFIAQEVQEVIPHTVYEDKEGMLSMSDRGVVAHMHKAILELEKRLISIEEKLK
jgi:hypothetical protein